MAKSLLLVYFLISLFLVILILSLFYAVSKLETWDFNFSSGFECGFSTYFFSRFSFSVHYFIVSLIFLFLDLELSFVFIFFFSYNSSIFLLLNLILFIGALLVGLILEWWEGKLDWVY